MSGSVSKSVSKKIILILLSVVVAFENVPTYVYAMENPEEITNEISDCR